MQTRLSRICDAIIEAGWLAALVVTPLFFNTFSNRVFEPDKLHLLRSIALVLAAVWLVQLVDSGAGPGGLRGLWARLRATPLVLSALALVLVYLVSTVLSLTPHISFFGSYVRMQGTFTFLSYVVLFALVLTHLRTRAQLNRLLFTVVLSSLPISIYGIIQHYGQDALPWGGDVKERVAANMGNSIFVAAYLIMALFLTLERLLDSMVALLSEERGSTADALRAGAYLFILAVQVITIVFTQSRGPWLGLAAGLYVFVLMGTLLLARWAAGRSRLPAWISRAVRPVWLGMIGLTVAGLAFLIVLNIPQGPLAKLREVRYIGRLGTLLSTTEGTNAVRVLIWEGVVDMMLKPHAPLQYPDGSGDTLNPIRPLIGYGPESMWVAYNSFYPPELAHYEARNASPDRSHNETFDALVRTGLIGLAIQLVLYASVFYYALRWLGLMRDRGRRNLFVGLLIGGAALGVIIPLLADHSLRLAGVGLPAGFIFGVIVYVTLDLLLAPVAGTLARSETGQSGQVAPGGARRQLLILALFSAIVAHFIEIHFGIAIASTLTHFWVLSGVLVVVGMGWLEGDTVPALAPAEERRPVTDDRRPASADQRAVPAEAHGRKAHPQATGRASTPAKTGKASETLRRAPAPTVRASEAARRPSPIAAILPYAGIGALITLVLTWDYVINQTGQTSAWGVLWNAFTTRVDAANFRVVASPMLLILLLFTWLIGALLAASAAAQAAPGKATAGRIAGQMLLYVSISAGVWLIYGLIQADRSMMRGLAGLNVFHQLAGHIAVFDTVLLLLGLLVAAGIWAADTRPRPTRTSRGLLLLPLSVGAIAAVAALLLIVNVNVRTVQADTYYKQGLAYEGSGAWDGSIVLYREAALRQPEEDFYYLFLGRSLLQYSTMTPVTGTATLPADLTHVPTSELLPLTERALRARNREDVLRGANAALTAAQRLNPLNTDHAANLARLNRSWAFVNALGPNEGPSNALLRQIVATRPKDVDMAKLSAALTYYRQSTMLSPQNAQLQNEMASVQFVMGDTAGALQTLAHSLELDSIFTQTYLLRGDLLATGGDKAGALADYRAVALIAPDDISVQSAVGVYSAQTGDNEGSLAAFRKITEVETAALASAQAQQRDLEAQVNRSGGYSMLLGSATGRRDALQGAIASHRSQLHLAYRNMALVQRDMGRLQDALTTARIALTHASDSERPTTDALIADIQKRLSGG